jgi:predicted lipopolysaccharide heptosyltransferase III
MTAARLPNQILCEEELRGLDENFQRLDIAPLSGKSDDAHRLPLQMKILLLQLKRIGDLILTTPAIAALREKFPDAKLTLAIAEQCAELLPAIPNVDESLVTRRVLNDLTAALAIARTKFDFCIDFTRNDRSAFLTLLSGARKRIASGKIKSQSKVRALFYNEFVACRMRNMHTIDYHLALLEPLGIRNASRMLQVTLPPAACAKADELRKDYKIGNQFIVFHPGSARVEKFWETGRWREVIGHAVENYGLDVVLTGGTAPLEQAHLAEIKSGSPRLIDLSGRTDLLTLAALIARARLLMTVDSAAMHLAAATRTPQVALFGPTNPFHWRPRDSVALILQGVSPTPLVNFVVKQPRIPMKQISTEAVIGAMDSLLSVPAAQIT